MPAASPATLPVDLPNLPDLGDHAIAGRTIVPAVWLLELLVRAVAGHQRWSLPLPLPLVMSEVAFPRFLAAEDIPRCTFEVKVEQAESGVAASLLSSMALPNGMRRTREHARVMFGMRATGSTGFPPSPPLLACDYAVTAERVYRELITFGPRYCNLRETIRLGPDGGMGIVRSPVPPQQPPPWAGCPYLVDSAMHLACVWGQRYAGYIAYPTGFAARLLVQPTPWGDRRCTVVPRAVEPRRLVCDLWLCDERGAVCDTILGLTMSPLANGPRPPSWITQTQEPR